LDLDLLDLDLLRSKRDVMRDVSSISQEFRTNTRRRGHGDFLDLLVCISDNRPIAWIIHGFMNDITLDNVFNQTKDAYIDRGFSVIMVDWTKGNREYFQSIANVRVVGALVGQMMDWLNVHTRSLCVGFSLGSHICGEAGSFLQSKGKVLQECHGVDPAGPAFDGCNDFRLRLDPSSH